MVEAKSNLPAVAISDVQKSFGQLHVLNGINMTVTQVV